MVLEAVRRHPTVRDKGPPVDVEATQTSSFSQHDTSSSKESDAAAIDAGGSLEHFLATRRLTERLCEPLANEDYGLQAMASTSPAKWHLAHVTWFFETFVLSPFCPDYRPFHPAFEHLFNSYYNGVGRPYPREKRGLLSRPGVEEVYRYRAHVDSAMTDLLSAPGASDTEVRRRTELGCHHEQQHQELLFTDLKYCWFQNPLYPAYTPLRGNTTSDSGPMGWLPLASGVHAIGSLTDDATGPGGFCFDNELPRHRQYLEASELADRLVTNAEFLAFVEDDGYRRPELWLADGWAELQSLQAVAAKAGPLYWLQENGQWFEYTLHGQLPLDPHRPVCHVSAYEADAYARWVGCRLPTEFEWEVACEGWGHHAAAQGAGQFLRLDELHPASPVGGASADRLLGRAWQWTSSAYAPYPGFRTAAGAIGEYNGKFMANQLVLRGGSCVTSRSHYRDSYRNFFYPPDQWQFTGIRLARDLV